MTSETEAEAFIRDWCLTTLSEPHVVFNNLPACPYARAGFLNHKVKFLHCGRPDWTQVIAAWDGKADVLVVLVHEPMEVAYFHALMEHGNHALRQAGLIGLEDHPDYVEEVGGVRLNNGRYQLLLIQNEAALDKAREKLAAQGYYQNWPADYLEEVTGRTLNPACSG